jgi:hypothetical protein
MHRRSDWHNTIQWHLLYWWQPDAQHDEHAAAQHQYVHAMVPCLLLASQANSSSKTSSSSSSSSSKQHWLWRRPQPQRWSRGDQQQAVQAEPALNQQQAGGLCWRWQQPFDRCQRLRQRRQRRPSTDICNLAM